jgi:hypothetical protein
VDRLVNEVPQARDLPPAGVADCKVGLKSPLLRIRQKAVDVIVQEYAGFIMVHGSSTLPMNNAFVC